MSLSKKDIAILKTYGLDVDKLSAAIADENEVSLDLPTVKIYTDTELATRDKAKYEEGKTSGVEMAVKDYKEAKGLDFRGKKLENLIAHIEDASSGDEVVKTLRKSVKEHETKLTDALSKITQAEERANKVELQSQIHSIIPDIKGYTKRELQAIAEANSIEIRKEEGKLVPYRNGEKWLDEKLATPLDPNIAFKKFFEEEKKFGQEAPPPPARQGGGGGNSKPPEGGKTVLTKMSAVREKYKELNPGKSTNGEDFQTYSLSRMKEAKDAGEAFVMD